MITTVLLAMCGTAGFAAQESDSGARPSEGQVWLGADYWANPLQDWRLRDGRIECHVSGGDRNVTALTYELADRPGDFRMEVELGALLDRDGGEALPNRGWVGFRIGIRGRFDDYRDSALRGRGLPVGLDFETRRLFIGQVEQAELAGFTRITPSSKLRLTAEPNGERYRLRIELTHIDSSEWPQCVQEDVHPDWLQGLLALVCSNEKSIELDPTQARPKSIPRASLKRQGRLRFWFRNWRLSGSKLERHRERAFGPILFAQHTLSRRVLKLTAHLAPLELEGLRVQLWEHAGGEGLGQPPKLLSEAVVDPLARTARFRIVAWDDTRDRPYELRLVREQAHGRLTVGRYRGTIRKNPRRKEQIVVAAFTGNNDVGFPHQDIAAHVQVHEPDMLVYTGDQLYERVGDYGIQRRPLQVATLDYLRKWHIFGWEYGELLRDIPSVCLPDDHDVYHGNIWGAGGKATEGGGSKGQDTGGYTMDPIWVNMVQRTQTSHHPDPYDPTPIEQDISVYYGSMNYGGVSFAIVEDRKWKSAPRGLLPKADIWNGWAQNRDYDAARDGDVADAVLLGRRQLDFLEAWAADWSEQAWMKVVLSQTIFANVATLPEETRSDQSTPRLRVMQPGEYAENEKHVQDHDSNGWPQSGRNAALRTMRKAFALHIAGDQHLGSTIQYGIDAWRDAGYAICVPSVANVWPRRWFPPEPGLRREANQPRYTGDFRDGFGNLMTVYAVSNPIANGIEPTEIHHRAPGYGIVRLERVSRQAVLENWPRWVDPQEPGAEPYPGWPIRVAQRENYARKPWGYLPELRVHGMKNPVLQVIDESNDELVYALRLPESSYRPAVFDDGVYTVRVGEPDRNRWSEETGLRPSREGTAFLDIVFQ